MKKILYSCLVFLVVLGFLLPNITRAQTDINTTTSTDSIAPQTVEFVLFHSKTCPHCKDEIKFINKKLKPKYADLVDFKLYEIGDPVNQKLMQQYGYYYQVDVRGVPLTFIDGEAVHGFGSDKSTGQQIIEILDNKLYDKGLITEKINAPVCNLENEDCIQIPLLGRIDMKSFSLPVLTLIIGLLDGFNPCAMWVLLFLISLLLGMEDKRRMWLLGSLFIVASGSVYFVFMGAWLHFLMFVGMILFVRIIVGLVAIGVGGKNIMDFWKNRKAEGVVCEVSKNEGTKKTFEKIKDIVYRRSLWWSILGILILGFSVNLVELACSAGFPAIYTQVLAMSNLPMWQRYLYMLGYIFFYMLDDMIIFFVAMATLKSKVVGTKYAKYTNLVAGLLILVLGILLIFKPEWLMFS